ncbi:unnamed protein product [Echinostoma caproni]|uniref:Uncharacterized protein n=1 Tax=Echinostoma caproni TaxID=27848 RepID=A0A183ASN5_9TREM|nr:unnamed protein product [Echinostoma caproni]
MTPAYLIFGRELSLQTDATALVAPAEVVSTPQFTQQLRQKLHTAYESDNSVDPPAHLRQKQQYDRSLNGPSYAKGDKVWLNRPKPPVGACAKFHRPWQGPYEIVFIRSPMVYVIRDISSATDDVLTVHNNQPKPAGRPQLSESPQFVPPGCVPMVERTEKVPQGVGQVNYVKTSSKYSAFAKRG